MHKGLQFMGSRGAGGGKAGSGVERGVPSSGRGGQAREGFPGREDGGQHSGQRGVGVRLVSSPACIPGQVPTHL